jgi:hypothetical protein
MVITKALGVMLLPVHGGMRGHLVIFNFGGKPFVGMRIGVGDDPEKEPTDDVLLLKFPFSRERVGPMAAEAATGDMCVDLGPAVVHVDKAELTNFRVGMPESGNLIVNSAGLSIAGNWGPGGSESAAWNIRTGQHARPSKDDWCLAAWQIGVIDGSNQFVSF